MKGGTDGLSIWDFVRFNNGVKRAARQFFASCKIYGEITRMTHFPPLERLPSWVKIWNPDIVSFISNYHKTYSRAFFSLEYLIITTFFLFFFCLTPFCIQRPHFRWIDIVLRIFYQSVGNDSVKRGWGGMDGQRLAQSQIPLVILWRRSVNELVWRVMNDHICPWTLFWVTVAPKNSQLNIITFREIHLLNKLTFLLDLLKTTALMYLDRHVTRCQEVRLNLRQWK